MHKVIDVYIIQDMDGPLPATTQSLSGAWSQPVSHFSTYSSAGKLQSKTGRIKYQKH